MFEPGTFRRVRGAVLVGVLALTLTGCDTTQKLLIGKNPKDPGPVSPAAPPPQLNAGFVGGSALESPFSGGPQIVPPTLPMRLEDNPADSTEIPTSTPGPHHPLAVLPFSPDPAVLAPLGVAANKDQPADALFVLLVLAAPSADPATLDRTTIAARQAAKAAVKALANAGIAADRVEVSMATSPDVGEGQLRLYAR